MEIRLSQHLRNDQRGAFERLLAAAAGGGGFTNDILRWTSIKSFRMN